MTNFHLPVHLPTHTHTPKMCVHSAVACTEACFFSPWAAELWSGQATGARGEVVRKERTMEDRQTAKGTAMRAGAATGMRPRLAVPPAPSLPTPSPSSSESLCPTPGTQNSDSPLAPFPASVLPLQTSPLQTPWKPQKSLSPKLNHRRPRAAAGREGLQRPAFCNTFSHSSPEPHLPTTPKDLPRSAPFFQCQTPQRTP